MGDALMAKCKGDMETFYGLAKGGIEPIGILFRWLLRVWRARTQSCAGAECGSCAQGTAT